MQDKVAHVQKLCDVIIIHTATVKNKFTNEMGTLSIEIRITDYL